MRNHPSLGRRALPLTAAGLALGGAAQVQPAWPDRLVRLITPGGPGTSPDVAARLYAERLGARWGVPVAVENRAGADGTLAAEHLTQQRDGHALLFTFISALTVAPRRSLLWAESNFRLHCCYRSPLLPEPRTRERVGLSASTRTIRATR